MKAPKYSPEAQAEQLDNLDRRAFQEIAELWLASHPSQGAIAALAEKNPDRWAQALAIVGRLRGFTEKVEANVSLSASISTLSDAELLARIGSFDDNVDRQSSLHDDNPSDSNGLEPSE